MSVSVDTINLRFNVKPDYDQQQLQQLEQDLKIDNTFRYYYKLLTSMNPNDKEYARIEMLVKELATQIANRQSGSSFWGLSARHDYFSFSMDRESLIKWTNSSKSYFQRVEMSNFAPKAQNKDFLYE